MSFFTKVTDNMVMWLTGIEKQSRCTLDAHDNKSCFAVAGLLMQIANPNGQQAVGCIWRDVRGKIKSRHFTHKKKFKVPKVPQSHITICQPYPQWHWQNLKLCNFILSQETLPWWPSMQKRANLSKFFLQLIDMNLQGNWVKEQLLHRDNPIWDIVFSPEGQAVVKGTDTQPEYESPLK